MAHVEGMSCLEQMIKRHFHHAKIGEEVRKQLKGCHECALYKRGGKTYGEAAHRDASVLPWQEVHCDSIGPWTIELRAKTLTFQAMTMIDPATNLVEIAPLKSKTALAGAASVENTWLARYPRPVRIVSDQGPEFATEFTDMCNRLGIEHNNSTSRNPRGNAMVERCHQAVGQVLRLVVASKNPKSTHEGEAVMQECYATVMHACRCATQSTIGNLSPGAIAFGRDMFLDIPIIADILTLQKHRQGLVDKHLLRANAQRIPHDYKVGDLVYKKNHLGFSDKLKPTHSGPFRIAPVHTNGTVTLQYSPMSFERINIRRIRPKF